MLCSEASLVKHDENGGHAVTLRCRAWTCDFCQPWRKAQLTALAQAGRPTKFITLTVKPDAAYGPSDRARLLPDAWRVVVRRAKAKYGYKEIPYLCVFEATKKGEPHLHILARVKWISQRWMSDQMRELTGSPVCHITEVKTARQVASYVTKYIGKAPHRFATCKRYWCTRDWDLSGWERDPDPILLDAPWRKLAIDLVTLQADWDFGGWATWRRGHHLWGDAHAPPF